MTGFAVENLMKRFRFCPDFVAVNRSVTMANTLTLTMSDLSRALYRLRACQFGLLDFGPTEPRCAERHVGTGYFP